MDRKNLLFRINRIYDVLTLKERCEVFEHLANTCDDNALSELYKYMDNKYFPLKSIDIRTDVCYHRNTNGGDEIGKL